MAIFRLLYEEVLYMEYNTSSYTTLKMAIVDRPKHVA
jgi:hypothetical protein